MKTETTVQWTKPMLERFRKAYQHAVERGDSDPRPLDTFIFDGNEYVIAYAKYLIMYLDGKFGGGE